MDIGALTGTLISCVVMAATVALTAWRVDAVSRRKGGADDYFWVVFGGGVVVLGAGVVAGTTGAPGALLALGVGVGSVVTAAAWSSRQHGRRRAETAAVTWADLHGRHDAAVRRWADYDVDPAKAIDYPAMHDPASPAGRPVIRALRAARLERADAEGAGTPPLRYTDAVDELERAVDEAEQALGVRGAPLPPPRGRHRSDLESLPAGRPPRTPGS